MMTIKFFSYIYIFFFVKDKESRVEETENERFLLFKEKFLEEKQVEIINMKEGVEDKEDTRITEENKKEKKRKGKKEKNSIENKIKKEEQVQTYIFRSIFVSFNILIEENISRLIKNHKK